MRQPPPRYAPSGFRCSLVLAVLLSAARLMAQPTGQWDFTNGDLTATVGQDLQYTDGPGGATQTGSSFGTTTSFGIPDINGTPAKVMKFPAAVNGMGYLMPTPANPNGGGNYVNDYTLVFDLLYPQSSDAQLRPLIDTDGATFKEGPDLIIDSSDGVGIGPSGPVFGKLSPNTWYRLGIVVQQDQNLITFYLNGGRVGAWTIAGTGQNTDGRFALQAGVTALILATTDTNAAPGYVNSIQLRDVALSAGQMKALGGPSATGVPQTIPPVPSFIDTRTPDVDQTGVVPDPAIHVLLNQGDTTVDGGSIKLYMDGRLLPVTQASAPPTFTLDYAVTNILRPLSPHRLDLVYSDSVAGLQTNSWSFTITDYQNVTLPQPFYIEGFDEVAEGSLPAGWVATNNTQTVDAGFDLLNPNSDTYKDWVVISTNTVVAITSWDSARRLALPPIVLNGVLLDSLIHSNFVYAESDQRNGSQVQVLFSPDIDCSNETNVFVAWHSIYEQNQDNMDAVEYSIDQGKTWLPVMYMFDDGTTSGDGSDIITNSSTGQIDVFATFGTPRTDQAYGLAYSNFIGAAVSTNLIPYMVGRRNDDPISSKRIEVVRLPFADGQSHVRFRFSQAGTGSWYFGVDDLGLYSINTPVIVSQFGSQTVDANTTVSLSVTATGKGNLSYQWEFNGNSIPGATNSTYTIQSAQPSDAGLYDVVVSNSDGPTTSGSAQLTVITTPVILSEPQDMVAYVNTSVTIAAGARGGQPLSYQWYHDGTAVSGGTSANLTLTGLKTSDSGNYSLVVSNSFGTNATTSAHLTVYSGAITGGLVAHLKFDGDYSDASGSGTTGTAVGTPTFETGILGQAVHVTSTGTPANSPDTNNYVSLGTVPQLQFGTNDFSISLWAKIFSQNDDKPFISNKDWGSGGNLGWVLATEGGGTKVNFRDNQSDRRDSPTVAPQLKDGNWHNLVVTFIRNSVATIYVDGQLINSTSIAPDSGKTVGSADTAFPVNIGQDGTGHYTDGGSGAAVDMLVDDVGIWNRALAPTEAASIYVQGQAGKDLSTASGAPVVLPATVATDPVGQTVSAGATATFTVTPGGSAPFTYSWLKNGAPIGNATSSNLTLTAVTANDAALYAAVVSNAGGSATSHVAQLVVFTGPITQSLVAHLKFDGDYKDASGLGTDGSAVGTPSFQAGMIGQAVHVNSAGTPADNPSPNNYVSLGNPSQLQFGTNDFSVSFWTKINSQNDDKPFISNKDWNSGSNPGWALATEGDGMKWNFRDDQSARRDSAHAGPQLEDGNWHHVVVSFMRSAAGRIYVDGQLVNTSNLAPDSGKTIGSVNTTNSVNIGQDGTGLYTDGGGAAAVDMLVDDLGIWSRAVTPQEALAIFNAGKAGQDLSQAGQSTPGLTLQVSASGGNIVLNWTGATGLKLQKTTSLSQPSWTTIQGTDGASTYSEPLNGTAAFYRLSGQ